MVESTENNNRLTFEDIINEGGVSKKCFLKLLVNVNETSLESASLRTIHGISRWQRAKCKQHRNQIEVVELLHQGFT